MPESESESNLTDAETLATLDALGELDSEENANGLAEAFESNPELAELKETAAKLNAVVDETEIPEMPARMLAALEKNRQVALDEASHKVVSFLSKPAALLAAAAAILLLVFVVSQLGPQGDLASMTHAQALAMARAYPVTVTKSFQPPPEHLLLVEHLGILIKNGKKTEAREILLALPSEARRLADFEELAKESAKDNP